MNDPFDLLKEMGLGDFANTLSSLSEDHPAQCSVLWRGEPLQAGGMYRLQAASEHDAETQLAALSTPIYFHTLLDQSVGGSSVAYYAESVETLAPLMEAHAKHGDCAFVIMPAIALRHGWMPNSLGAALEALRHLTYQLRELGVVVVLVDLDLAEGKSEARKLIHRFTLDKLY
jgi:hypothetical protein